MFKKNPLALIDWKALAMIMAILVIGVLTIFSATYNSSGGSGTPLYFKQIGWIVIGFAFFFAGETIDYQTIARYSYPLYVVSLILLMLVMVIGSKGFGAQRWLSVGGFTFQPSELTKLATVLAIVRYFSDYPARYGYTVKELLIPGVIIAVPVLIVLKQPDLGTALVITFVSLVLIYLVRIRSKFIGLSILIAIMTFPFVWQIFWESLKGYQKTRLLTFIDPTADPRGTGYHIIQSKIAVGSGGFWGKGLFASTQSHLNFLPARHTDFVFSVFAEEWGFIGFVILMVLYLGLITWGLDAAVKARDRLGMLMGSGLVSLFTCYCLINLGMTLGIVPVVGIPLPLMSYGGTSLITTLFSLGILFNIKKKRYLFS